jgi:hypothetical protein
LWDADDRRLSRAASARQHRITCKKAGKLSNSKDSLIMQFRSSITVMEWVNPRSVATWMTKLKDLGATR